MVRWRLAAPRRLQAALRGRLVGAGELARADVGAQDEDRLRADGQERVAVERVAHVGELPLLDLRRDREGERSSARSRRGPRCPPTSGPAARAWRARRRRRAPARRREPRGPPSPLPLKRSRRFGEIRGSQAAQQARARPVDLVIGRLGRPSSPSGPPCSPLAHERVILPHGPNPSRTRTNSFPPRSPSRPSVEPVEAIGVDLGGTKMLVGVVDSERRVVYRSTATSHRARARTSCSADARARAARGARCAPGRRSRPGSGSRARSTASAASRSPSVNLQHRRRPGSRPDVASGSACPSSSTTTPTSPTLAEHRFGAGRGARNARHADDRHRDRRRAGPRRASSTGARPAPAPSWGTRSSTPTVPAARATARTAAASRRCASGTAIAREGLAAAEAAPDSALGRALAETGRDRRQAGDRRGAGRRRDRASRWSPESGRRLGVALASFANIFDPDVIVIGGGASRGGRAAAGAGARELASRALPPMSETPVAPAELGPEAGHDRRRGDGARGGRAT